MEPILKRAGGKRQLLEHLSKFISPEDLKGHTYFEPFVGGGALLFYFCPEKAVINDVNSELMLMYSVIKEKPNELIEQLKIFKNGYPNNYESIRSMDRNPEEFKKSSSIVHAARFIYLNKTCYNGLYRVNSSGFFNVPIGKYKNPNIINENRIKKISDYFLNNKIKIKNTDFTKAVSTAKKGDVIYFDPPYDYENTGFTTYSAEGFCKEDLIRLKKLCDSLIKKGCKVIVSNNDTEFVNKLFENYTIEHIGAKRFINCDGKKRCCAKEVIIYGCK